MGNTRRSIFFTAAFIALGLSAASLRADSPKKDFDKLSISRDSTTGQIVITWSGRGVLKRAASPHGRFDPIRTRGARFVVEPSEPVAVFREESASPNYSVNAVGYVRVPLPPGLTLVANPLRHTNDVVATVCPHLPDGTQVLKYVPGGGYEVSTYDALAGAWSHPDLPVPPGEGFFLRNVSGETAEQVFVGEVLQGYLVNPLPAGASMKGALVPRIGSINDVHEIPGLPGDEIRFHVNDGAGGEHYLISIFSADEGRWVPDLVLNPAQGFWIQKQQAQDWVLEFSVNP